jgi:outer membrane protein TolC
MSFLRALQAKEAGVRVAKLENAPDVEFRVEARQYNGRSGFQEYDTGVFLNFPWLWRGKYRAMQQEAKADLAMAQADFDGEVNLTMLEIKELFTRTESAARLQKVFEERLLPQSQQLIATTRANYEAGTATFLELIESQKAARDAQLGYERARADFGKAHAKLDAIAAPWGEFEFATGLVTRDMK